MSEGEFDRNAVIVGMVSRLSPPEWRAVVRYFAPHLAATDRQLLADILFAEANRRCAQFGRSPLDHFADVLDELRRPGGDDSGQAQGDDVTQPDPTPDDSRPEYHPLTPGGPCPGNGTCCDREECDRAIFPCPLADQHAAEVRRLRALVDSLAERCARQSEALSRRAEPPVPRPLFEAAVRVLRGKNNDLKDQAAVSRENRRGEGLCDTAERIIRRAAACGVGEEG